MSFDRLRMSGIEARREYSPLTGMVKSAFFGFLIALGCLLPPIVHFVSGPLGPLIGGWFAGTRAKGGEACLVGLLMAVFMITPMVMVIAATPVLKGFLPSGVQSILTIVAVVVVLYMFLMGSLGAWLGGLMSSKKEEAVVVDKAATPMNHNHQPV